MLEIYRKLGLPGACGSMDATHVSWGNELFTLILNYVGLTKDTTGEETNVFELKEYLVLKIKITTKLELYRYSLVLQLVLPLHF